MLSVQDRAEIVAAKGLFTADELSKIFECNRGRITRVWSDAANGHVPSKKRINTVFGNGKTNTIAKAVEELPPEPIVSTGKTLMQIADSECYWIIGRDTDGDFRYCAEPAGKNLKRRLRCYCPTHAQAISGPGVSISDYAAEEPRIAAKVSDQGFIGADSNSVFWDLKREVALMAGAFDHGTWCSSRFPYGTPKSR